MYLEHTSVYWWTNLKNRLTKLSRSLNPHSYHCDGFWICMVNYQYSTCAVLGIPLEDTKTNTEVSRANPNTSSPTVGSINRISYNSEFHLRRFKFCSWFFCWFYGEDFESHPKIRNSTSGFFVRQLGDEHESVKKQFCCSVGNLCAWIGFFVFEQILQNNPYWMP